MSSTSTGTVWAGGTAQMAFSFLPSEYVYDSTQLKNVAKLEADGDVVITGIFAPLAVTLDGYPGVLPGDTIQGVIDSTHSTSGDSRHQLQFALLHGGALNLLVATRPKRFNVDICCEGASSNKKLGILVTIERQHGDRLKIQAVHEHGLLPDWNRENPKCQVMPGDWITRVNGEAEGAQEMAAHIRNGDWDGNIALTIQSRPRVMDSDVGDIQVRSNPRSYRKLPQRSRVGTGDWTQMQETLRSRSML